ncbi:hypothetical protein FA13DRAFT_1156346 [Coprinellus micaceus]|uniref:Uncharacterized protein n=1 Tax=Coprinellus micaceus TaxID=71717 RepID=A0A4Y7SV23_COPMI|nr:hypothetical protein FA13DRAFT_1156346 [Coprinellus micaceus]
MQRYTCDACHRARVWPVGNPNLCDVSQAQTASSRETWGPSAQRMDSERRSTFGMTCLLFDRAGRLPLTGHFSLLKTTSRATKTNCRKGRRSWKGRCPRQRRRFPMDKGVRRRLNSVAAHPKAPSSHSPPRLTYSRRSIKLSSVILSYDTRSFCTGTQRAFGGLDMTNHCISSPAALRPTVGPSLRTKTLWVLLGTSFV